MIFAVVTSLVIALILPTSVSATGKFTAHTQDDLAYYAAVEYISEYATFSDNPYDYSVYCTSPAAMGTIAEFYVYIGNSSARIGYFIDYCNEYGADLTIEEFYAQYQNATKHSVNPSGPQYNASSITYSPIKLNVSTSLLYYESYRGRYMNFNMAYVFGSVLVCYWALIVICAGCVNWSLYFFPQIANFPLVKQWRQYLALPAVYRGHKSDTRFLRIFHFLIPSRMDTVIIGIWLVLALIGMVTRYEMVFPNVLFDTELIMKSRLVADRAGCMALFNLPLLVLFAGRNNFVQFITRWSFARMIAIHRWVSRTAVIMVLIHTICMCNSMIHKGSFARANADDYVRWGYVAVTSGVIILVQASLFFRRKSYEVFYLMHLLLAMFFMIGGFKHVEDFEYGYDIFLYTVFAIWSFDRFLRVVRLLSFGAPKALIELCAYETLKITVPKPSYWHTAPGQHAFVHFLRWTSFWQSHPFTFVDTGDAEHICFYVKIKGGITNEIYKYVKRQPNLKAHIRVSVEGPYGSRVPVQRFDKAVFLSGGNGIPGLYSEALDLSRHKDSRQELSFYWVIRTWKSLDWFQQEIEKFAETKVKPVIYVTRPDIIEGVSFFGSSDSSNSSSDDASNVEKLAVHNIHEKTWTTEDLIEKIKEQYPFVEFRTGRPKIHEIVSEEIETSTGSIAFVSCAHPHMVDDTRAAVWKRQNSKKLVEFFDQLQVW